MAKVVFTKFQDYHHRYSEFQNYSVTSFNKKTGILRLTYDENRDGREFESDRSPWSIKVQFADIKTFKPTQGERAGETVITSGTIQYVEWMNKAGKVQVKLTETGLDAGIFYDFVIDDPWKAYENLVGEDSTYIGPRSLIRGMDVKTGAGDDVVRAGKGGCYIKDKGGTDKYVGTDGDSWDTVSYDNWNYSNHPFNRGVSVNLAKEKAIGPDGNVDQLIDIDRVVGTNRNDTMRGTDGSDTFSGLRGQDVFYGGKGDDRVQYYQDRYDGGDAGIVANLIKGRVRDGYGTIDKLFNIENVEGSEADDWILGNNKSNWFRGRDGADKFVFKGIKFGHDDIDDFSRDEGDKIVIKAANKFRDLTIRQKDGDTIITLNKDSKVVLQDYDDGLVPSDFIL
ncbi:hypothetical protein CLV78_10335 [Aliiruegeria haliotis]|uniref:Hemolysin type calcium-binding protein n=1 Tax=Aliiruegeria haliotis TaxID=1280846 RepID=A0A2T0RSN8_9RHOB|nr:calcium-binding protein [Aliiruegeria haliotis]PRY24171.1 hypothetical protein CLV78_10335 [Aliiruegeria haliotis]